MAIEAGADGIEFDVRLAKDSVPVVIHDATLRRTAGLNARVADLTSAELATIDIGSWFNSRHAKCAKAEYAFERVPTLEAALELLASFDGLVYIELKCGHKFLPLVDDVCRVLRGSPRLSNIVVKSFRLPALSRVRERLPNVETAALFGPSIKNILRRRQNIIDLARSVGATQLSLHRSLATPRLAALAHRAKMPVTVWTVNDPDWIRRARKLDIKAVITNDATRLLQARAAELGNEDHQDNI